MDDLLQEFIAETRETLAALGSEVVAWEADPSDRARLDAIFRFVHTVKGSCGFLDLPRLSRLSHAAEDGLQAVRDGERVPDARFVDGVLAVVDRIGELVEAIDAGVGLDDSDDEELIRGLGTEVAAEPVVAAPAAASADVAGEGTTRTRSTRTVRLGVDLLDRMMAGMSDLVLVRNELARRVRGTDADPGVEAALERLSSTVADLRDTVSRTRMQKLDSLFAALPRIVRDTAAELGKTVTLAMDGGDVELDREMIELVRDPLTHILRNAIDHGIEAPAARTAAAKPAGGRIRVVARQVGNQIEIVIADDGRGIDVPALVDRLVRRGELDAATAARMDEAARLNLIFRPGVSTAAAVTAVSGRGVGMDVVRANVERIGGVVHLHNAPGQGLRVLLRVPLTLSIIAAISLGAGGCTMALPRSAVEEIASTANPLLTIETLGDARIARLRDRALPLIDLAALLGRGTGAEAGFVIVVGGAGGSYALAVDTIGDHEELVIKPAAPQVMAAGIYAGEALPDSGMPLLILDAAGVAAAAGVRFASEAFLPADEGAEVTDGGAATVEHLLFAALDGTRHAVPLSLVDHILPIDTGAISVVADRAFMAVEGGLMPLAGGGAAAARGRQALLLRAGDATRLVAIAEAQEIVGIADDAAGAEDGGIAVLAVGDEVVRRLDVAALFGGDGPAARRPAIRLVPDTGGAARLLRPLFAAAGWSVRAESERGAADDIVVMTDDAEPDASSGGGGRVVRLHSRQGGPPDAIDPGDADAVLAAVARAERGEVACSI